MKISFRRFLSCMCIIAMLFAFAACTNNGDDTVNGDEATEAPAEVIATSDTELPDETETMTAEPTEEVGDDEPHVFYENEFSIIGSRHGNFFETEDSLYIANEGMMYYSDKEYHEWMPLCGKPDCSHNDRNCNARFEGERYSLYAVTIYDKYIYYTVEEWQDNRPKIYRMNLDGSRHEKVWEFERPEGEYDFSELERWEVDCFCGRFFCYRYLPYGSHTNLGEVGGTYAIDISNMERGPVKLDEYYGMEKISRFDPLGQNGETVYTAVSFENEGTEEYYIGAIDLSTGESHLVCKTDTYILSTDRGFDIKDDKILCVLVDYEKLEQTIISVDIATGTVTEINKTPNKASWACVDLSEGYIIGANMAGFIEDNWCFHVYDLEGNELQRIEVDGLPEGVELLAESYISEDYIFFHDSRSADSCTVIPQWYIEKKDLCTDKLEFKAWEP